MCACACVAGAASDGLLLLSLQALQQWVHAGIVLSDLLETPALARGLIRALREPAAATLAAEVLFELVAAVEVLPARPVAVGWLVAQLHAEVAPQLAPDPDPGPAADPAAAAGSLRDSSARGPRLRSRRALGPSSATAAGIRWRSSIPKSFGRRSRSCRSRQLRSSARGRHSDFCEGVGTDRLALPTWMALVLSARCRASQNHAPASVSGPAPLLSRQLRLEASLGAPSSSSGSQNSTRLPRQLLRHAAPQHERNASSRCASGVLLVLPVPCIFAGSEARAVSPAMATSSG